MQRQPLQLAAHLDEAVKILLADVAAADAVAGNPRLLGEQPGGKLLGAHFQRKDRHCPLGDRVRVGGARLRQQRLRGAIGDLGRQRRLAHAGPPSDDHEVGRMQPAGLLVEVAQACGQPGNMAGAVERPLGAVDRLLQRLLERQHRPVAAAAHREVEQRLLGRLHLLPAVEFGVGAERVVDHGLADVDQLPAQPGVVDRRGHTRRR